MRIGYARVSTLDQNPEPAKALLADGSLTSKEVAARFGVSKATLNRYLDQGK